MAGAVGTNNSMAFAERPRVKGTRVLRLVATGDARVRDILPGAGGIRRLQLIAQTWERLLSYSGGALNLSKCFYYVLYWEWPHGLPVLRSSSPEDPTIVLTSGSSTSVSTIKRLDPNIASRTLGVFLSPPASEQSK
jgi:hypothetical protein